MNLTPRRRPFLLALAFLLVAAGLCAAPGCLRAQGYWPETEWHDATQRRFPVELARVLAWRENQSAGGGNVAEVTWQLQPPTDGQVRWTLGWRDADGKTLRETTVTYPEDKPKAGPAFYRDVFTQMTGEKGLAKAIPPAASNNDRGEETLRRGYWQGAEAAGLSRADTLLAAGRLLTAGAAGKTPVPAPQLAGLLTAGTLPSLGGALTLDRSLLARAAAWLCVAEAEAGARGPAADGLWAPLLFLTGREHAARELWKSAAPGGNTGTTAAAADGPLGRWWDFILRSPAPSSTEAFAFAAEPKNRRFAMPFLLSYAERFALGATLGETAETLFNGRGEHTLALLHDYAPYFGRHTGVGGGHVSGGRWPALARDAWARCLREFPAEAPEEAGFAELLKKLPPAEASKKPDADALDGGRGDASLRGFNALAPVIAEGAGLGAGGRLTPVAVATARDLLNFGWEQTGATMGARWVFCQHRWGVPETATPIADAVLGKITGLEPFFVDNPSRFETDEPNVWQYAKHRPAIDFQRFEDVDELLEWLVTRQILAPSKPENAERFARRFWMRPAAVRPMASAFYHADKFDRVVPMLARLRAEAGGPAGGRIESAAFWFLARDLTADGARRVPHSAELRTEVARALPEPASGQVNALWDLDYRKLDDFHRAQAQERLFWQRPGSDLHFYNDIFAGYLRAHAYDAARRFYAQAEPLLDERVGFSNGLGPRRFTLALMEDDAAGMRAAQRASGTGSYADMVLNIVAAAANGQDEKVRAIAQGALERYGSHPEMSKLIDFAPLLPALRDPAHPDRAKALDFFAGVKEWPTLQWVWIKRCKLSTEDAVRFLGGPDTNPERRLLVLALQGNREAFGKAFTEFFRNTRAGNMAFVVLNFLRNELLNVPVPAEQPDLRPAGAQSISQALTARLTQIANAEDSEDLAAFNTADKLWAHLENLKEGPKTQPKTREEALNLVRTHLHRLDAAAAEFIRRYPADPRRWDARFLTLQLAETLARVEPDREGPDESEKEFALREIAYAKDALPRTKADALYTLIALIPDRMERIEGSGPALAELAGEIDLFEKTYPGDPRRDAVRLDRAQLLERMDPAGAATLLETLGKSERPEIAMEARSRLAMAALKDKPLDLRFTAMDGREFDLAKLRGKVVLVDFWATWCGPCLAQMPELIEAYGKLHDRGLEIVGISLDEEKEPVLAVTKARGMPWPEYFDGKGWENEISSRYGIHAIPRQWLVNKQGRVVNFQAGKDLTAEIEKLLAEP